MAQGTQLVEVLPAADGGHRDELVISGDSAGDPVP